MTTANFEETNPPEPPRRGFRRPADYYSSATPDPAFPQWLSLGCGGLALLALVVIFAAAAWVGTTGFGQFLDISLGLSLGEMRGMYAPAVPQADKDRFEKEVETMREHLRTDRVAAAKLQPFLRELGRSTSDGKVTADEVRRLTSHASSVNRVAKK